MIGLQFNLPEEEYKAAEQVAGQLGISVEELASRALRRFLADCSSKPWMKYAGMVESGDPFSSQTVDDD